MITSLDQLDLSKQYTYADYLLWQFDQFVELLRGKIVPMAAPSARHQDISIALASIFKQYLRTTHKNCKAYHAPFDVRLIKNALGKTDKDIYSVVQPDLCIICDRNKIDERGCLGAPDLIVEILSPNNSKKDLQDKFLLYEENEVLEYWIVFPFDQIVQKFVLEQGKYQFIGSYTAQDQLSSSVFPDLQVNIGEIFED